MSQSPTYPEDSDSDHDSLFEGSDDSFDYSPHSDGEDCECSPDAKPFPRRPPLISHSTSRSLANWAPDHQKPVISQGEAVPQLPDFLSAGPNAPTSLNNFSSVYQEVEATISQLLSLDVFERLLQDVNGRRRFREVLAATRRETGTFDLWADLLLFNRQTAELKMTSIALQDTLAMDSADNNGVLPEEQAEDLMSALDQLRPMRLLVADALELPQKTLLSSLFRNEFQSFVRFKLVEHASVKLGQVGLSPGERKGLGEAFCLTNPRLRDHPIVLVSAGFERLTGYKSSEICGRNCRMLAGPGTSQATSKRIRNAINRGESLTTLVLNYRRNGEPFWNLLCILPLRGSNGEFTYFIGGQTEVSGLLATGSSLPFLIGSEVAVTTPFDVPAPSSHSSRSDLTIDSVSRAESVRGSRRESDTTSLIDSGSTHSRPQRRGIVGMFKDLGGAAKAEKRLSKLSMGDDGLPIGHADSAFAQDAGPLENQLAQYTDVYSKLIIFRCKKREVVFVTRDFLEFCGLPYMDPSDAYKSALLTIDFLKIVTASSETGLDDKELRNAIKEAISANKPLSVACGIGLRQKKEASTFKSAVLHLTPICDATGAAEAFVAIIG